MGEQRAVSVDQADRDARWTHLVDDNLPPRALWPDVVYEPAGLRYPATLNLADELIHGSGAAPGRTAIFFRDEPVSYGELRRRMLAMAGKLTRAGVEPTDRVAFMMPNCPDLVATWLAVQWVGAIGVPVPPTYRRREIEHIL